MEMRVLLALLCIQTAVGVVLLLIPQFTPHPVSSYSDFLGNSAEMYAASFSTEYCLSAWVRFPVATPGSDVSVLSVRTPPTDINLEAVIHSDGSVEARGKTYSTPLSTVSTPPSQISLNQWALIAVCGCSGQLSISVTSFKAIVQPVVCPVTSAFWEYNPTKSFVRVGGDVGAGMSV